MQIHVKFVNLPGPQSSGKYGSIVGTDGVKVMVPAEMLDEFRAGMSYEIGTKTQVWGKGTDREAEMIICTAPPGGPTGRVQGQGARPSLHGTPSRETGQRATTGFQPQVFQGGRGQGTNLDEARRIFACGVVQQAMSTGKFTASEIPVLTQSACDAFDKMLGPKPSEPPPARAAVMPAEPPPFDDPIPDLQ